jgi:hypothetical protein
MRIKLALLLAALAMAAAPQAQARNGRNGALLGGLAIGAVGAAVLMNGVRPAHGAPIAEDAEYEVVERPRPRYVPTCRMERRRVWIDSESYTYKRVEVCE